MQARDPFGIAPGSLTPDAGFKFKSTTIAPSPPPTTPQNQSSNLLPLDTSARLHSSLSTSDGRLSPSPLSASLRIQTDIIPGCVVTAASAINTAGTSGDFTHIAPRPEIKRTPSIKNVLASSFGSSGSAPSSALSSPMLNAMPDVTPLPSPLMSNGSPGPWRKAARPPSREHLPLTADSALVTSNGESVSAAIANQTKRRAYHGLVTSANENALHNSALGINREKIVDGHQRNRSLSDYTPDAIQIPKPRHITVSGSHAEATPDSATSDSTMRREPHLAVQRGLEVAPRPPTPPPSNTGQEGSDSESSLTADQVWDIMKAKYEYFDAYSRGDKKKRRWRGLKVLGEGTFSKVVLATSQVPDDSPDAQVADSQADGPPSPSPEAQIDRKKLVAVKVCEHGPKGGASEDRIEVSLKRELEIMKSVNHPSLVRLKAWATEESRMILVLTYCPGGDLFDVATKYKDLLVPGLLRRMFAELVGAVRYLHSAHIVHRDIKLENVLVNLTQNELAENRDWATYPYSVVTLTDLGLSRYVTDDQLLQTRCGSDDYAAPEVIMGQDYNGRATDAWSLGVLLYALLESRLPFDVHPRMTEAQRMRSRTTHRIARIEWVWVEYGGDEGDNEADSAKFKAAGLEGAQITTEGLLKRARSRWTMDKLAEYEWVKDGITVEGGVKFREEDTPKEVVG
ncbi:kinase-like domain-containing protein [Bisporella sp. PMI_857]|nr:kinase-like domain-containing protein [Bisporella sp. PMI_857]